MTNTLRESVSVLCAAVLVVLSISATAPAYARGGGWMVHQSTKFMMENGSHFGMNTRAEALADQSQPAQDQVANTNKIRPSSRPGSFDTQSDCYLKSWELICP